MSRTLGPLPFERTERRSRRSGLAVFLSRVSVVGGVGAVDAPYVHVLHRLLVVARRRVAPPGVREEVADLFERLALGLRQEEEEEEPAQ